NRAGRNRRPNVVPADHPANHAGSLLPVRRHGELVPQSAQTSRAPETSRTNLPRRPRTPRNRLGLFPPTSPVILRERRTESRSASVGEGSASTVTPDARRYLHSFAAVLLRSREIDAPRRYITHGPNRPRSRHRSSRRHPRRLHRRRRRRPDSARAGAAVRPRSASRGRNLARRAATTSRNSRRVRVLQARASESDLRAAARRRPVDWRILRRDLRGQAAGANAAPHLRRIFAADFDSNALQIVTALNASCCARLARSNPPY